MFALLCSVRFWFTFGLLTGLRFSLLGSLTHFNGATTHHLDEIMPCGDANEFWIIRALGRSALIINSEIFLPKNVPVENEKPQYRHYHLLIQLHYREYRKVMAHHGMSCWTIQSLNKYLHLVSVDDDPKQLRKLNEMPQGFDEGWRH